MINIAITLQYITNGILYIISLFISGGPNLIFVKYNFAYIGGVKLFWKNGNLIPEINNASPVLVSYLHFMPSSNGSWVDSLFIHIVSCNLCDMFSTYFLLFDVQSITKLKILNIVLGYNF